MLTNVIRFLTNVTRWIALAVMAFMMFFIAIAVISRLTVTPIIGDVEIVQLGMIVLIMCGLAYTQRVDGHISIGIIVDRFPQKGQLVMDAIGSLLNVVVTLIIAYIYVGVFLNHKNEMQ
ncbi:TRAP transporter small permease, partial [Pueribacillus theae]